MPIHNKGAAHPDFFNRKQGLKKRTIHSLVQLSSQKNSNRDDDDDFTCKGKLLEYEKRLDEISRRLRGATKSILQKQQLINKLEMKVKMSQRGLVDDFYAQQEERINLLSFNMQRQKDIIVAKDVEITKMKLEMNQLGDWKILRNHKEQIDKLTFSRRKVQEAIAIRDAQNNQLKKRMQQLMANSMEEAGRSKQVEDRYVKRIKTLEREILLQKSNTIFDASEITFLIVLMSMSRISLNKRKR